MKPSFKKSSADYRSPELAQFTKGVLARVRRLELRMRGVVQTALGGQYRSVFKGRGMNFDEFRQYQIGDEIRTIDWNVTARTGEAHIRKYVEERELTVVLAVDISASGIYGSVSTSKRELAAEVAALLAFCAIRNNDNVGLLLFTDQIELYLPPRRGRASTLRLIREVLVFKPQRRATNLSCGLEFLNRVLPRRSVVFLLSDFHASGYEQALSICSRKHDLIAVSIEDPGEWTLPQAGIVSVEDPENGRFYEVNFSNERVRQSYAQAARRSRETRDQLLRQKKVDLLNLRTDADYFPPLQAFFQKRERRLRF